MKAAFRKSFARDLKKVKDQTILDRIAAAIEQVEASAELKEIGRSRN